jgi:hypothetical protein
MSYYSANTLFLSNLHSPICHEINILKFKNKDVDILFLGTSFNS